MAKYLTLAGLQAFLEKLKGYVATTSRNGLMSAEDKGKVSNIFMTMADSYGRISKYLVNFGTSAYISKVSAYPLMRVGNVEALYHIRVKTTKPTLVVVRVSGSEANVIEVPTINIPEGNVASFTLVLPTSSAYVPYTTMIIDTTL